MKSIKFIPILLFAFCFLLVLSVAERLISRSVFAQKEYDDYNYQYQNYQQAYQSFTLSRDAYIKFQTLQSREEAISATKKFIIQRNDVLRSYFLALKLKLRTTQGVVSTQRQADLVSSLDKEIIWLENENNQVNSLTSPALDDLFIYSDHLESRKEDLLLLAYQSLATILVGKANALQAESIGIGTLLGDRINKYQATGSAQLKEWLRAVDNQNYLSQKEIETAETKYNSFGIEKREDRMVQIYAEIQNTLEKFRTNISQSVGFQKEINAFFTYESRL